MTWNVFAQPTNEFQLHSPTVATESAERERRRRRLRLSAGLALSRERQAQPETFA
jgi:hypothetical protein